MEPYRSMLFVPGHKPTWTDKGIAAGADAIILDLEDSVPAAEKESARAAARSTIQRLHREAAVAGVWVRPNGSETDLQGSDLEAVVRPGLTGLILPKVSSVDELVGVSAVLSYLEEQRGIVKESIGLIVCFETAEAMAECEDLARATTRVRSLLGATGPDADVGNALGFEFTPGGWETLYLRSRILLAARAAGLAHPITGVWQDIKDLDGARQFYEDARGLGYRGTVCIHPSHVPIANEVFTPSQDTVDYSRRLVAAFDAAEAAGSAAVTFEGQHIDIAHVRTAESIIARAEALSR